MGSLLDFKVPKVWGKTYPSIKALAPWMRDLVERVEAFDAWINDALPRVFWLPSFTYPTGFLTALLQTSARWDPDNGFLTELSPMELMATMPVSHFKPVDNK